MGMRLGGEGVRGEKVEMSLGGEGVRGEKYCACIVRMWRVSAKEKGKWQVTHQLYTHPLAAASAQG